MKQMHVSKLYMLLSRLDITGGSRSSSRKRRKPEQQQEAEAAGAAAGGGDSASWSRARGEGIACVRERK